MGSMDGDEGLSGGGGVIPGIAGPIGIGLWAAGFRAGLTARLTRPAPPFALAALFLVVRLPFRAERVARPRAVRFTRRRGPVRARILRPVRLLAIPRPSPFPVYTDFAPADARGVCSTGHTLFLSPGRSFPGRNEYAAGVGGTGAFPPHAAYVVAALRRSSYRSGGCGSPAGLFFFSSFLPASPQAEALRRPRSSQVRPPDHGRIRLTTPQRPGAPPARSRVLPNPPSS